MAWRQSLFGSSSARSSIAIATATAATAVTSPSAFTVAFTVAFTAASPRSQQLRTFTSTRCAQSAHTRPIPSNHTRFHPIRLSTRFSPTHKPTQSSSPSSSSPNDDVLPSLQLLLRGGYIRSSSSGVFTLLPNALRIVRNITNIIDDELSRISASRLSLPTLLPSKLWRQTGRYHLMGSELYKLRDRRQSEFVLGPTHEEEITKLVSHEIDSHRQLPLRLYQITRKFRDEPRPRMGLLRTKEFVMNDLYTFDTSEVDAVRTYHEVTRAYSRVFDRVFGLPRTWKAAEADTGAIGGNKSHEYHVEDPAGEDTLISCTSCSYTANTEKAVSMPQPSHMPVVATDVRVLLFGCTNPNIHHQPMHAFVLPQVRPLNYTKLQKLVAKLASSSPKSTRQTPPNQHDKIELLYDSAPDSNHSSTPRWDWNDRPDGPLVRFTSLSVLADFECASLDPSELNHALVCAINRFTSPPRHPSDPSAQLGLVDLFPTQFGHFSSSPCAVSPPLTLVDIRTAQTNDTCPSCKSAHALHETKAIEIAHTFFLGDKYSRALQAGYLASAEAKAETHGVETLANGRIPFQMGCYGIGVSRLLGAVAQKATSDFDRLFNTIQAKNPKTGFVWPEEIAPFTAIVIVSDPKDPLKVEAAENVFHRIVDTARLHDSSVNQVLSSIVEQNTSNSVRDSGAEAGWSREEAQEVVIDDRAVSVGSKLADSDLMGYRYRLIVGNHFSSDGKIEVQFVQPCGWDSMLVPLSTFGRDTV